MTTLNPPTTPPTQLSVDPTLQRYLDIKKARFENGSSTFHDEDKWQALGAIDYALMDRLINSEQHSQLRGGIYSWKTGLKGRVRLDCVLSYLCEAYAFEYILNALAEWQKSRRAFRRPWFCKGECVDPKTCDGFHPRW